MIELARRAQMQQLFIFLSAIIVIIASVYLGLKLFSTVESTACESMDIAFFQDVVQALDASAEFGSTNRVTIRPSCDSTLLCFVDNDALLEKNYDTISAVPGGDVSTDALRRLVATGAKYTIYQYSDDVFLPVGYDERVRVTTGGNAPQPRDVICIKNVNGFTFNTNGGGRTITISPST